MCSEIFGLLALCSTNFCFILYGMLYRNCIVLQKQTETLHLKDSGLYEGSVLVLSTTNLLVGVLKIMLMIMLRGDCHHVCLLVCRDGGMRNIRNEFGLFSFSPSVLCLLFCQSVREGMRGRRKYKK